MTVNQISIFLENKYGKLSEILALLAEERIRIIAATVADTSEYGILRIIVSDPQKAYKFHDSGHQHIIYVLFIHPGKSDLDLAYEQPGKRP